jgi:hypothetical protein
LPLEIEDSSRFQVQAGADDLEKVDIGAGQPEIVGATVGISDDNIGDLDVCAVELFSSMLASVLARVFYWELNLEAAGRIEVALQPESRRAGEAQHHGFAARG